MSKLSQLHTATAVWFVGTVTNPDIASLLFELIFVESDSMDTVGTASFTVVITVEVESSTPLELYTTTVNSKVAALVIVAAAISFVASFAKDRTSVSSSSL